MWKALACKDIRETIGIAALGLLALILAASAAMRIAVDPTGLVMQGGPHDSEIPFVGGTFKSHFTVISFLLVVALGFRQSLGESFQSGYLYLFHRPTSRARVLAVKMIVGITIYLVCGAISILAVGLWAQTPGTHASPFEWSMTIPVWRVWLSMPVIYLGAMLSGMRPARWAGTRLAPLVGVMVLTALIQDLPYWMILGPLSLLAVVAALIINIVSVSQTRDYA